MKNRWNPECAQVEGAWTPFGVHKQCSLKLSKHLNQFIFVLSHFVKTTFFHSLIQSVIRSQSHQNQNIIRILQGLGLVQTSVTECWPLKAEKGPKNLFFFLKNKIYPIIFFVAYIFQLCQNIGAKIISHTGEKERETGRWL